LTDSSQPADKRQWQLYNSSQQFGIFAAKDDGSLDSLGGQVTISRAGAVAISNQVSISGSIFQNIGGYLYPGGIAGMAAYQNQQFLASHSAYGLYTNTGLYVGYHFKQSKASYIYPGDAANATDGQSTYYLASHPSYGLYSNTALYAAGGIYVGGGNLYNYVNGGHFYVLNAAGNGWLDTVTIDGANRMCLFANGVSMRIISPALGGAIGGGTSSAQSVYVYVDGVGQVRIPVYT
jgi:hypothetical protein